MSYLISRKELIERAYKEEKGMNEPFKSEFGVLVDWLANKTGVGWIPCKKKLPKAEYGESYNVLASTEYKLIRILYFNGGNWCYPTGETFTDKVVAWMPLPEAYHVECEEEADR